MAYQSFVDHSYSALPKFRVGPVEGMGDFATSTGVREVAGPTISKARLGARTLKGAGVRGALRAATGPVPLTIAALQPLAQATANQAVQSGQYAEPGITKAMPGTFPGRVIDVRGISNTNPFTGQTVTNYANRVQPDSIWNSDVQPNVAPWVAHPEDWSQERTPIPNSVTPIAAPPTKPNEPVKLPSLPSQPQVLPVQGGTNLNDLLKTIQSIQPVEDYAHRINALNTGNTTWDMNGLAKILVAKSGQRADEERYNQQVSALTGLGSAQMNADAARAGHEIQARSDVAKNAYMAPYYESEAKKNTAEAKAAPLRSITGLIENQNKLVLSDKDKLEQAVKILNQFGALVPSDPSDPSYELYHNAKDTFDYLTSKRK